MSSGSGVYNNAHYFVKWCMMVLVHLGNLYKAYHFVTQGHITLLLGKGLLGILPCDIC